MSACSTGSAPRLGGRTAGLLAATLLAFSSFHIWYSQEARMYTLLAFAATAHAYALLAFLDRQDPRNAVLTFLAGAALVYSHPFGALTWVAIGLGAACVAGPRDFKAFTRLVLVSVAIGLAFLPWAIVLLGRARAIADHGFGIGCLIGSLPAVLLRAALGILRARRPAIASSFIVSHPRASSNRLLFAKA
jgi:uncharacterized membrane protein